MSKLHYNLLALIAIIGFSLTFTACGGDGNETEEDTEKLEIEEQDRYEAFVSPEIERILVETLGLKIHRGIRPPMMEGYYLLQATCTKSTIIGDSYLGRYIADYAYNLYNQRNLKVDFLGFELSSGTSIIAAEHTGDGTFITGEGDLFSIFFNEKISSDGGKYVINP